MVSHTKFTAIFIGAALVIGGYGINHYFFQKEEEWGFEFLEDKDPSYLLPNGKIEKRKRDRPYKPKGELQSTGTGVLLSEDGIIATCAHVVEGASRVKVKSARNTKNAEIANVILIDPENDLALVQIGPGLHRPAALGDPQEVKLGQSVFTIGYPNIYVQGLEPKLTKGEISGMKGMFDDPTRWQISVPVQNGNSGGPLFDMNGNVLGIIDSRLLPTKDARSASAVVQNVNYAVKNTHLLGLLLKTPEFLKNLPDKKRRGLRSFEEIVEQAEQSVVLIMVY
jgi:S1-C subfamily serine protease